MSKQYEDPIAIGSTIKALGKNRIGGYLIAFTDESRADLYGEFFDAKTDLQIDDFPIKGIPTVFHHGFDETIGTRGIGRVDTVKIDDKGVWVEAILKEHEDYMAEIMALVDRGVLGWSSGAWPQAVRVSDNGHIDVWPVIEASATHTPAMPQDTAIASVRSLKPVSLREQTSTSAREVTVRTSGGAVSSIHVDYDVSDAITNTTHTHTDIGEPEVDKTKLADSLQKVTALKMLDEEARAEILDLIRNEISDAIGVMGEEMRMEDELDDEAKAAADEEAAAAAADALDEETKNASGDEVKAAVRSAMDKPAVLSAIALAWAKGYSQAREAKLERTRKALAQAINEANMSGNGKSLGNGAKGTLGANGGNGSNIQVGDNLKYAHLTAGDMAFGIIATRANSGSRPPLEFDSPTSYVSEDYLKNFAAKAVKSVADAPNMSNMKSHQRQLAVKNWQAQKGTIPFRADELNAADIAGQGLEWIGDYWSNEVWEFAREVSLFDRLVSGGMMVRDVPQGTDSIKIPTAGSDPVVYSAPEGGNIEANDNQPAAVVNFNAFGTGNVTLTPGQLILAMSLTTILGEDSVINTGSYVNALMTTVLSEHIVKSIINGDTTTTANNNINLNDGTPGTGISRPYYLVTDGFRHYGLVDATSYKRDAGGTLGIDDFRTTMTLLSLPVRGKKQNLLFIIDGNTESAALALSEIATDDVRRTNATVTSGVLQNIYGIDVATTEHLPLTGVAGTTPGAGGTVGSILLPFLPYWAFGYKRRITLETVRNPYAQSDDYVASVRFGLVSRSTTDALAMSYNTTT